MTDFGNAFMTMEVERGRILLKLLKALVTAAAVFVAIFCLFCPLFIWAGARIWPKAFTSGLWPFLARGDVMDSLRHGLGVEMAWVCVLTMGALIIAGSVKLARTVWRWLG